MSANATERSTPERPMPERFRRAPARSSLHTGAAGHHRAMSTADVLMSLLAVALVAAAVLIANWGALTAGAGPTDAEAAADTAAALADAIAQARTERATDLRHAAVVQALADAR